MSTTDHRRGLLPGPGAMSPAAATKLAHSVTHAVDWSLNAGVDRLFSMIEDLDEDDRRAIRWYASRLFEAADATLPGRPS